MTKSSMVRESVINGYLNGKSYEEIANDNNIARGSVFNIIQSWIAQIGIPDIDELREFSVIVKKSGITIKQCAQSFRFIQIMASLGIRDEIDSVNIISKNSKNHPVLTSRDNFYYFIEFIYNQCKNLGIKSTDVVGWMQDMIDFSSLIFDNDDNSTSRFERNIDEMKSRDNNKKFLYKNSAKPRNNETNVQIPFISKISGYIEQKKLECQNLDLNNKELHRQIEELEEQKNKRTYNIINLKKKESVSLRYLDWYNNLKEGLLDQYDINLEEEINSFVNMFNDFKDHGYDAHAIVKEHNQIVSLRAEKDSMQGIVESHKYTRDELLNEIERLKQSEEYSKQSIKIVTELHNAGFGFEELRQLKDTVVEISVENNISWFEAGKKFIKDIENQYDNKLGFEPKIMELELKLKKLKAEEPHYREYLISKDIVSRALSFLYKFGVTDDDIINMSDVVMAYLNGNITFRPNQQPEDLTDENRLIVKSYYWKSFILEIKNLGDINSQIENQRSYLKSLKKEIVDLNSQRQKLNEQTLLSVQILNTLTFRLSSFMEFFKQIMHPVKDTNNMLIVYQPLFFINVIFRDDPKDDDNNINTNN